MVLLHYKEPRQPKVNIHYMKALVSSSSVFHYDGIINT